MPEYTGDVTGLGTTRMLEAIKRLNRGTRFYQASTSELFGSAKPPQNENTPFHPPQSPYAVAKLYAYWMVENYRDGYDMFTVNGILFNHESPRRGETFVTRKITRAVAAIMAKKQDKLFLGNLDSKRDWGVTRRSTLRRCTNFAAGNTENYVSELGGNPDSVRDFLDAALVMWTWIGGEIC